jgi:ribosomal protein L32
MKKLSKSTRPMRALARSEFKLPKVEVCSSCKSQVFEEDICCFCECCMGNSKDRFALRAHFPCCECPEWSELIPER